MDLDSRTMATSLYHDSFENSQPTALGPPAYDGENLHRPSPSPTVQVGGPAGLTELLTPEFELQTIVISTAFNPETHETEPDIIFSSSDCVLFYVDTQTITRTSPNAFQELISAFHYGGAENDTPAGLRTIIPISESSVVLNIILHSLYASPCTQHSPPFRALVEAVYNMPLYGISPGTHITRTTYLYAALLAYAPIYPLVLYTLAGQHKIHDLAVATSSHLLSCSFFSITDEMAERMGSIYLKRLLELHLGRFNSLKELVLSPPPPHLPTKDCSLIDQKGLTRAWALVSAYLVWDARADLSTHNMKLAFSALTKDVTCKECNNCLEYKLQEVIMKWASVKRTI
ncbi:hypothetical protein BDN72DRAFT_850838 [Pluteus cervinus]|uniref:Uncharacterized protein n=1 Tax=Pluteus cervinus TaxID=181527 RepID=A0ACD3A346_9AGAR|nr:hypothetical protein BDN72DRAFT_850838 [Pluteus cervinus]